MVYRFRTLDEALARIEPGAPANSARIVVSGAWWETLPDAQRNTYRTQCELRGVSLKADDRLSRHFVELSNGDVPPLSSESMA
jgi:hypothetical protein